MRERPLGGASAAQWLQAGVVAARARRTSLGRSLPARPRHLVDPSRRSPCGDRALRGGHAPAARRRKLHAEEADAEQRLALAYIETGRYDEAQALLQSAAAQAGARDDRATMAGVRVAEGTLKRRQGDLQGAIAAYFEALPLVEEDRGQTATVLNNIGLAYRALGQPQQAAGCLEAALAVHRDLGNRREELVTLDNLAGVAWDAWDLERAERLYGEAREAAREVGDRRQEAKALANLGTVYEKGGDAQRSLSCLEEALPILRELGDVAAQAAALNNLAVARLRADPAGALSLLGESLELNVKLGDRVAQGKVLNVIGDAWYALRDGEQAHKAYRASLDLSRATGDRGTEAQVLQNLGLLQHAMKNHGEAALAYQRSLEIMREIGDRNGEAVNLSNLASIAFTSGDPALARSRLEEALAIMMEIGDRRSAEAIQRNLDELARETASAAPPAPAPASAPETEDENAREVLIAFLHAEGPMRAIHYAKHKAILQSPEVEAMLQRPRRRGARLRRCRHGRLRRERPRVPARHAGGRRRALTLTGRPPQARRFSKDGPAPGRQPADGYDHAIMNAAAASGQRNGSARSSSSSSPGSFGLRGLPGWIIDDLAALGGLDQLGIGARVQVGDVGLLVAVVGEHLVLICVHSLQVEQRARLDVGVVARGRCGLGLRPRRFGEQRRRPRGLRGCRRRASAARHCRRLRACACFPRSTLACEQAFGVRVVDAAELLQAVPHLAAAAAPCAASGSGRR